MLSLKRKLTGSRKRSRQQVHEKEIEVDEAQEATGTFTLSFT